MPDELIFTDLSLVLPNIVVDWLSLICFIIKTFQVTSFLSIPAPSLLLLVFQCLAILFPFLPQTEELCLRLDSDTRHFHFDKFIFDWLGYPFKMVYRTWQQPILAIIIFLFNFPNFIYLINLSFPITKELLFDFAHELPHMPEFIDCLFPSYRLTAVL